MAVYFNSTKDIVKGNRNSSSPVALFIIVCKDINCFSAAYDRNRKYGDESSKEETTAEATTTPVKEVAPDAPICDLPSDEDDPFKDFKDY